MPGGGNGSLALAGLISLVSALPVEALTYDIAADRVAETVGGDVRTYLGRRTETGAFTVGGVVPTAIHVGDTAFAKAKGLGSETLANEEWVIRSFGGDIVLNGRGRGLTAAAVHFLDDECGIRWWSVYEEYVPKGDLRLPALDRRGRPAFAWRNVYTTPKNLPNEAAFHARTLLNGRGDESYGPVLRYGSGGRVHTFSRYLPDDRYFKAHPEWFMFSRKRNCRRGAQICLTHPEVRAHFKRLFRENVEKDRRELAGHPEISPLYDLSQNDCIEYCECPACAAAIGRKGCSGLLLDFVNDVVSSVTNDYPDVRVRTYAYQWSAPPPKDDTRAIDNVLLEFCNTGSSLAGSVNDPDNPWLLETLGEWSRHAKHLMVWDYAVNYGRRTQGFPIPGEFGYADLFKACRDHGVDAVYIEHENQHHSDMWELKYRLETKLMDDPEADAGHIIADFMHEYYGAAGEDVLAYRRLLWEARRRGKGFVRWIPSVQAFDFITEADIDAGERLFDTAEAKVKGEATLLGRVRHARLGLDLLLVTRERMAGRGDSPRLRAALGRAEADLSERFRRYPRGDGEWIDLSRAQLLGVPPPAKFRGRRFVDFPATMLRGQAGSGAAIVRDRTTPVGFSLRLPWEYREDPGMKLPFDVGMHVYASKKTLCAKSYEKPLGEGWRWYYVGRGYVSRDVRIWATRGWSIFLPCMYYDELWKKTHDIWISAKFTGPQYGLPSADGTSDIRVDRIVLVEPGRGSRPGDGD